MDPVSRRLAAAAMGVVFGLSRDDELEKTRLDLERARMEREDFRQGNGPFVFAMEAKTLNSNEIGRRKYRTRMRAKRTWRRALREEAKSREYFNLEYLDARQAMATDLRASARKRQRLHEIFRFFRQRGYTNYDVGEHSHDRGATDVGLGD